jgi:hypothetical protein
MLLARYLLALLLTIVIELSVAYVLGFRTKQVLLVIVMINFVTHPIVNYLILVLANVGFDLDLAVVSILELGVALAEWRLLVYVFDEQRRRLGVLAFAANLVSFALGLILFS